MFELIVMIALAPFAVATVLWVVLVSALVVKHAALPMLEILSWIAAGLLVYYAVLLAADPEGAAALYERWFVN